MARRYRPGRGAARKLDGTQRAHSEIPGRIADENDSASVRPAISSGEKYHFRCPACGANADATWTGQEWLIGSFSTHCYRGGNCLRAIARAAGTTAPLLKANPLSYLKQWVAVVQRQNDNLPELPTLGQISGWHSRLLSTPDALDYLLGRGISLEIIKRYRVGWDGDRQRLTFPMRGGLLKTRELGVGAQMKCWPGRGIGRAHV